MKEYTEIAIEAILFGFGVYSIMFLIGRPMLSDSKKAIIVKFDNSACFVAALVGAFYLVGGLTSVIVEYTTVKKQVEGFTMKDRLFGQYWIWYWIQPTFYLFSQLLWFKKIRKMKFVRFIVALILVTSIESLVIYFTSLNRDYLPGSWSTPISMRIMDWLISIGLFGATTTIFHIIKTKVKVNNPN